MNCNTIIETCGTKYISACISKKSETVSTSEPCTDRITPTASVVFPQWFQKYTICLFSANDGKEVSSVSIQRNVSVGFRGNVLKHWREMLRIWSEELKFNTIEWSAKAIVSREVLLYVFETDVSLHIDDDTRLNCLSVGWNLSAVIAFVFETSVSFVWWRR